MGNVRLYVKYSEQEIRVCSLIGGGVKIDIENN